MKTYLFPRQRQQTHRNILYGPEDQMSSAIVLSSLRKYVKLYQSSIV